MRYSTAALFYSLAGQVYGLPRPQGSTSSDTGSGSSSGSSSGSDSGSGSVPGPVDPSQVLNMPLPSRASGSLRGTEQLLGYNPSNLVTTESTVIPPDEFEIAPGQSEDPKLGLYIDLSNVENPQPIRGGTTGPTEPGPRQASRERR
ncbi:conserved hypothetical protein [Pyrenophora tritici-repentis Pt-1C-BFP]|uniref:Uncharacterized protein n=1 Tax=Pyrenophora tritici-repentis (strain Pt-1C-BFP) TaxID=426418 RepID=B2VWS3_PYRTR|nr:uncharacterized protein PTRG_01635 [Pyrenophora tritici-repentis Pt-1C-BFP]EDU41073.1 conserved hypothetical protein [Pyrenophora tritici-repentis Pt-1C-BFP]